MKTILLLALSMCFTTQAFGVKIHAVKNHFIVIKNDPTKRVPKMGQKVCLKSASNRCGDVVKVKRWYSAVSMTTKGVRAGEEVFFPVKAPPVKSVKPILPEPRRDNRQRLQKKVYEIIEDSEESEVAIDMPSIEALNEDGDDEDLESAYDEEDESEDHASDEESDLSRPKVNRNIFGDFLPES